MLALATVAMTLTVAGNGVGLAVFLDPMLRDLGLSRSLVSSFFTVGTLAAAGALPLLGRALDRFGARVVLTGVCVAFGVALAALAGAQGAATLAAAMVALRLVGLGAVNLSAIHALNQWFVRRRGYVVAGVGIVVAVAMGAYPTLLDAAVDRIGWRATVAVFAGLLALVFAPLVALGMRATPEAVGQRPDGGDPMGDDAEPEAPSVPLRAARRTAMLWILIGTDVAVALFVGGLTFHHYDLVAQGGVGRAEAVRAFLPLGLAGGAATALAGPLMRWTSPRLVALLTLASSAVALAASFELGRVPLAAYGVALGASQGFKNVLHGASFAHYFGRRWLGAIQGLAAGCAFVGTALGPLVFALARDLTGGYAPAQTAGLAALALLAYPALRAPAPTSAREASAPA